MTKHPWVQVPAGQIGVVIAQAGQPLPIGAKSAVYRSEFGNFTDLRTFIDKGGQKGVQRPVLSPGTLAPIHPVAFLVITKPEVYGLPVSNELSGFARKKGQLTFDAFGLEEKQLEVTRRTRQKAEGSATWWESLQPWKASRCRPETLPAASAASRILQLWSREEARTKARTRS